MDTLRRTPRGVRRLQPGQACELYVVDIESGERSLVHSSESLLLEAPNWSPDGRYLVVNGGGGLYRLPLEGGMPEQVPLGAVPGMNNDHVLSPDGSIAYVSAFDGHVYAVPWSGGDPWRVTNDNGPAFSAYLHGVSPDGQTLAYVGVRTAQDGTRTANVYTVPVGGGPDAQLTDDEFHDDGPEFSADGAWIYFNSERGSQAPGHAQLFRMRPDGTQIEQLTDDDRVNWFPHPAPDGSCVAYLSFPPGTVGHPADREVIVRVLESDGSVRDLVCLFGGQGTLNVSSWSPDGAALAYVAYPFRADGAAGRHIARQRELP